MQSVDNLPYVVVIWQLYKIQKLKNRLESASGEFNSLIRRKLTARVRWRKRHIALFFGEAIVDDVSILNELFPRAIDCTLACCPFYANSTKLRSLKNEAGLPKDKWIALINPLLVFFHAELEWTTSLPDSDALCLREMSDANVAIWKVLRRRMHPEVELNGQAAVRFFNKFGKVLLRLHRVDMRR